MTEAAREETMIERSALMHVSEYNFAYAAGEDSITVRLHTRCGDARRVWVLWQNLYDHVAPMLEKEMPLLATDGVQDAYESTIAIYSKRFKYCFRVEGEGETVYYTSDGPSEIMADKRGCFYYPCVNEDDRLRLPAWAEGNTIYQIWTDRFYCAGEPDEGCRAWGAPPDRNTRYGGNFAGIREKLPYLKSLGADILYLNPVFVSPSYHKYDISDYTRVEACFGGEEGLIKLVEAAHEAGIRVVLDAVMNHCSSEHPFFQDVLQRGEASPYSGWFLPESFPLSIQKRNYDSFGGLVAGMPRLATWNEDVAEYLVENTVMWTQKLNVDGWRLDVCDEVAHSLLKRLRMRLTQVRPDILIIGEIWNHAGRWTQGDEVHTVTNYKYRQAMLEYLGGTRDAEAFWNVLMHNRMQYKSPVYPYLVNVNGTHDTARIRRLLEHDEALCACAMALLLTLDGMPLIYYGDELFMDGGEDPDCRRAMAWQERESVFARGMRELMAFRGESETLRRGAVRLYRAQGRLVAFERSFGEESLLCAVNAGPAQTLLIDEEAQVLLGGGRIEGGALAMPEKSWAVCRLGEKLA